MPHTACCCASTYAELNMLLNIMVLATRAKDVFGDSSRRDNDSTRRTCDGRHCRDG